MPDFWATVDRLTGLQVFCGLLLVVMAFVSALAWVMHGLIGKAASPADPPRLPSETPDEDE